MGETALALTTVYARSERMVGRRIADEFVIVPILSRGADADAIFNLNRVGAFIWERLDGKLSGNAIVEAMLEHFDVDRQQAESDCRGFLAQLLEIGAITHAG
jgi:hypothetical protein